MDDVVSVASEGSALNDVVSMNEIAIGGFSLSVLLYVILGLIFKVSGEKIGDRFKPLIAIICGLGLGLLALVYLEQAWTAKNVIEFALRGFMAGAGAVGLYEVQRMAINPRT